MVSVSLAARTVLRRAGAVVAALDLLRLCLPEEVGALVMMQEHFDTAMGTGRWIGKVHEVLGKLAASLLHAACEGRSLLATSGKTHMVARTMQDVSLQLSGAAELAQTLRLLSALPQRCGADAAT
eukprot:NODE_4518_length_666_cov_246.631751.p2 GENE.NODE_4518_length_666_cov_246.631751~~NODE_4518_length_666_cov_246.631751.p2  ORF type:complete len:132 (+),score=42.32 NODE_4518_length_666_cov_246.631751:23-397(+)